MVATVIESSGNVFADLGFEPGEAAVLEMRAKLFNDLRSHLLSEGFSEEEASAKLQIGRGRAADIMRGKWDKFSLEHLIILEARVGRGMTLEFAA